MASLRLVVNCHLIRLKSPLTLYPGPAPSDLGLAPSAARDRGDLVPLVLRRAPPLSPLGVRRLCLGILNPMRGYLSIKIARRGSGVCPAHELPTQHDRPRPRPKRVLCAPTLATATDADVIGAAQARTACANRRRTVPRPARAEDLLVGHPLEQQRLHARAGLARLGAPRIQVHLSILPRRGLEVIVTVMFAHSQLVRVLLALIGQLDELRPA